MLHYCCVQNSLDHYPKGSALSDYIDDAQDQTERSTREAVSRTAQAAREPHDQLLLWVDKLGGLHEHNLRGTRQDRLAYMEAHRIDELPFAFAYTDGNRRFVGGNDANLRKLVEQRA